MKSYIIEWQEPNGAIHNGTFHGNTVRELRDHAETTTAGCKILSIVPISEKCEQKHHLVKKGLNYESKRFCFD